MEAVDISRKGSMGEINREVLDPDTCRKLVPEVSTIGRDARVYRYTDPQNGWVLSIATYGVENSGQLSLGGFRIAPEARTNCPEYNNDAEALQLATGMERKIEWSRLARVGGPIGLDHLDRLVGGKCVLYPLAGSRVGEPRDFDLLDFAITCLHDFDASTGIHITTGQDLGHGMMSDGVTSSLNYLHAHFVGSVISDTSLPTAAGNFYALSGALKAFQTELPRCLIGLLGCGNIGTHILERLEELGTQVVVVEARDEKRQELEASGIQVWGPEKKQEFLNLPIDAVVINANGGSLDTESVQTIARNENIKVVCGCENLIMPHHEDEEILLEARKLYCPTEYCGMMGYLTAVEEYLCQLEGKEFDIHMLCEAAAKIEKNAQLSSELVLAQDFGLSFSQAVRTVCLS